MLASLPARNDDDGVDDNDERDSNDCIKKEIVKSDDCIKNVKNLARLEVLASLPANRGVFGVEALVRPTA